MKFKEGQRIIAVDDGFDYGKAGNQGMPLLTHDYAIGWKGTVGNNNVINFDNGRVIRGCDRSSFKELKEELPMLTVGTKVLWDDKSYAMEMDNGTLKAAETTGIRGSDREIYEITMTSQQLPGYDDYKGDSQINDTIIRRISDGRVFFVQQRFLKAYVAVPKFKRGQFVEYGDEYARIIKVNGDRTYDITMQPSRYADGSIVIRGKSEEELKEAQ